MKKNYFAFAALAAAMVLASCNKDEGNDNPKFDGIGAVSIKIQNPGILTRATVDPTSGSGNVEIDGTLTVTLTHNEGQTMKIEIDPKQIDNNTKLTFWNVKNPTKIEATINGGVADYSNVAIIGGTPELQVLPANIPAYGEVGKNDITLTDQSASPDLTNSTTQTGASSGDENKTYQMYEASIQMSIPVARLEVSGITHVTHPDEEEDECKYSALTINGVYMDGLKATGGATGLTDYCWDGTSNTGTGATAILKDVINGTNGDNFLESGTWPAEDKTFAYNFYTGAGNPKFKIYFGHAEAAEGADPVLSPRYAMIEQYTDQNGDPVTMQAGRIYRITKAELKDKHILGDEGGETVYGVTVTVTEATWTVVDINADWKE
ncbi:hypothetical protein KG007_07205 [Alistipes sp. kh20]|uniref:hypothetical protein n=1 Tax=Alistipes montrealensis TaxID=2834113 RepID=UPI001BD084BF|nr:hypothetical protein [Alistipes montrealensis]MBS4765993.1 hypothetical protein [Alistipes montrealensis]